MNAHNEQHDSASPVVKQNLTTQPAAAQEAVGWQWRWLDTDNTWSEWVDGGSRKEIDARIARWKADGEDHRMQVRPLFAAPVTAAPAHPRALTASIARLDAFLDGECAELLTPAQSEAAALVLQELKRRMASTPAAPGIGLQAFRKVAMPLLCQMLCSHDAESVARKLHAALLDASPKGDAAEPLHAHYCNAQPSSAECICGLDSPKGGSEAADFTADEVNQVIDAALQRGTRLIPAESIEQMRAVLLERAQDDDECLHEFVAFRSDCIHCGKAYVPPQAGDAEVQP